MAAGYLAWRLREGASLEQALEGCLDDLDGFYTFLVGTEDGFVLRDPIACKPAVLAETDDWVAMASSGARSRSPAPPRRAPGSRRPAPAHALGARRSDGGRVEVTEAAVEVVDLAATPSASLNQRLHDLATTPGPRHWRVLNPNGAHAVACGLDADVEVEIDGHVGYYCAGMNKLATVRVHGNASTGLAENMMSGTVVIEGNAGQSVPLGTADCSSQGDAAARCGISMKGIDIVVRGSVGHLSGFMAQTGRLVVCGDAGEALGDSIYEARLYVRVGRRARRRLRRGEPAGGAPRRARRASGRPASTTRLRANFGATAPRGALHVQGRQRERLLVPSRQLPVCSADYLKGTWPTGPGTSGVVPLRQAGHRRDPCAAREGIYDIRGFGAKRACPTSTTCSSAPVVSRYPLEGYRERCDTDMTLGTRFAKRPLGSEDPGHDRRDEPRRAVGARQGGTGRGATEVGTSTTTGDGGATPEEREHSAILVYHSFLRYGMNPDDLRKADAVEVVVGRAPSRAAEACSSATRSPTASPRCATCRRASTSAAPRGIPIDQLTTSRSRSASLREITDWEKPIFVKVGATRTYYDVQLAVKAGADVIVVDGMQGGTAATQDVFIEHVGIPTLPAVRPSSTRPGAWMHRQVQLIVSADPHGRRRRQGARARRGRGLDRTAALVAMGDNAPEHDEAYRRIGSAAGYYDDWQAGRDPVGISTQEDELAARFDPELGGWRIANYLRVLNTQTLARACGKSHVHNLEPATSSR